MTMTHSPSNDERLARRANILAALSSHDHGDGCLGIIVDQALRDDPVATIAAVRQIVIDAEEDAALNRADESGEVD